MSYESIQSEVAAWPAQKLEKLHRFVADLRYRRRALKLARIEKLEDQEGYVGTIPGFRGLIATGDTKKETVEDLDSALQAWMELMIERGYELPRFGNQGAQRAASHSSRVIPA